MCPLHKMLVMVVTVMYVQTTVNSNEIVTKWGGKTRQKMREAPKAASPSLMKQTATLESTFQIRGIHSVFLTVFKYGAKVFCMFFMISIVRKSNI